MDSETNDKRPSSEEGGQVKAGDKVWVLCKVVNRNEGAAWVEVGSRYGRVWVNASDCRPVMSVVKESLTTEFNCPEIPDSSVESFKVGDAVRIKDDKDERLPLFIRSLQSSGSSNTPIALCVSECGKRVRWSAFEEMERIDKSDPLAPSPCMDGVNVDDFVDGIKARPVDIKGSMRSLAGTDTIQAGDLQWTDWDKKYRMCNFTIGMRVDQAIQRGKDNGQKWLFYRKVS